MKSVFRSMYFILFFLNLSGLSLQAGSLTSEDPEEDENKTLDSRDSGTRLEPLSQEQEDHVKKQLYTSYITLSQEDHPLYHQSQIIAFQKALSSLSADVDPSHLINLKATTVYNFFSLDLLKETQGHLLAPRQVSSIFKPFFGILCDDLETQEIIKREAVWRWLIPYLELPDIRLNAPTQNLQEAYMAQTDQLLREFTDRMEEDVFCLATLCGMVSAYNDNPRNRDKLPLALSLTSLKNKDFVASKAARLLEEDKIEKPFDLGNLSKTLLERILRPYNMIIDQEHLHALSSHDPIEAFKSVLVSVEKGQYYSWMSDRSLLVRTKKKLDLRKEVSQEVLQGFYNLVGRFINKQALLVVKESLTSKTPHEGNKNSS